MIDSTLSVPSLNPISQNKVARNAFALIALSMLPTAVGAWLGIILQIPLLMSQWPIATAIAFMGIAAAFIYIINNVANSAAAIPLMLAFTGFMGIMLSGILNAVLMLSNGWFMIAIAAIGTACITVGCSIYAASTKRDFSNIGGFLLGSVIALIVIGLINFWLQLSVISFLISAIAVLVFSALMVVDVQRVIEGGETNYVRAAMSIYLNVFNIFSNLLNLILLSSDD